MASPAETKSNLYLFYGQDDFSLRRKIDRWKEEFAKKYSSMAISFFDPTLREGWGDRAELLETELIQRLQDQLAPSLFSSKRLIIIRDGLPKKADQEKLISFLLELPAQVPKDFFVIFWQTSRPDGRLKFTKQFMAQVNVTEFNLPAGKQLDSWLMAMAKTLNVTISPAAADLLARFLGRDLAEEKKIGGRIIERKEAFDLWEAHSELSKLAAASDQIDPALVQAMIKPKVPDSVFALSDHLATRQSEKSFEALANYLDSTGGDEKSAFIKIIGLLSEQFRSLLLVSLLTESGLTPAAMAEKLGFKPGRIFILASHAKHWTPTTLKRLLAQLLAIDLKLKSSDPNPRLLVDLFIAQAK
ncbi:MAG: hypothetical protein A3J07_04365 [Candidatus Doudnabacteria bacterium RIFCSPLOWO2_02_FULL_49_13]|uniref:DNA polymerase III subunit delta n=1 Tax=Candidatus Doudnabacteria bacterium RIFCSPHIGHO2_12_FULL_48_16 TaxID=1817838 RepID=A0A1F5PJP4_9BACT|nr:MAG: hypothetical protein A3B77_03200 [Candidatus Doudnabacteria bacterium RIFCSPHIGHO2_02_FULL_49_24]OGE89124.1 MAG: hypothetical protein A2760_04135 [Candidatus Doudnabacteria bacterium RIFCSPHIGHO2_01_FULL_50_67]OGE90146.1 MAG: hypothetical protein A3E29_03505 [Candidatus Doudnabacteria bacterium RIFCSPHIGHO2_12_FULL_48_16]OGE97231.1 MAG: hypothetical protein A2990_01400 [Candidatus Doudnabacteria bacterium RIFCSPLOWO2_01_FULL_49_40]OGF03288.1 MAG: hypothetical protein A3J07_04365 [Candid